MQPDLSFLNTPPLQRSRFGNDFCWGTTISAFQTEGAVDRDGRSASVWDTFTRQKGKIKTGEHADDACLFYDRYETYLGLHKAMGFGHFRFSLAWPRILPDGVGPKHGGRINQAGLDFYHRLIDHCLALGLTPWVTLYHWDLPQALENKGGWPNRAIVDWFGDYVDVCTQAFGHKVKNWIVLNEPMAFSVLGYFTGQHAPGRRSLRNLLPVIHHTALAQAEGGRRIRQNLPDAYIGTTFSCSPIDAFTDSARDQSAARRIDALLNRLFVEPALGLGYPTGELPFLKGIWKGVAKPGDAERLAFPFDFVGLQHYFRAVVEQSYFMPYVWAKDVTPMRRNVPVITEMGWEVYPDTLYRILHQFAKYPTIGDLYVTESGAAFYDEVSDNAVHDPARTAYHQHYLHSLWRAQQEGVHVKGYFVWSLMDNFEWAEGYRPRFGLIYVDFRTHRHIMKTSGEWFRQFLLD